MVITLEIKYIREFVSLTETGSFFETSERLFVTTSSLSRHIKALEEELGVSLFERTTRKVVLSKHGKQFLPFAKMFIQVDDDCATAFNEEVQYAQGAINVGTIPTMRAYRINEVLSQYRRDNKNVTFNIHEADSTTLAKALKDEELDFAFLRDRHVSIDEFESIPIAQDHLVTVVPQSHRLASQKSISIRDLNGESLLMISRNSFMHRLCTDLCKAEGFQPRVVFTSHRAENLMELVEQGMGLAMLMKKPITPILPEGLLLVDVEPRVTTSVYLAYLKNHKLNAAGKRFLELCKSKTFDLI